MKDLVTIASYTDLPIAELAKAKLESEGIYCFLTNTNTVGVNWAYSAAIGGVEVKVNEHDAKKAYDILNEDQSHLLIEMDKSFPEDNKKDVCPKCGSQEISFVDKAKKSGALSLLTGLPFIFSPKLFQCKSCLNKFRIK